MLLASAIAILLTWIVAALVLLGVGSLVIRRFATDYLLPDAFWLGLGVSVALLEIWSLLFPVNSAIIALLSCLAAAGLIENRATIIKRLRNALHEAGWSAPLYLAIFLFLAVRASGPCDYYDTGLYGWQMVRWISTHPAVPGLANVHGRFGFNSSAFLCIAALSQGVWKGLGFHLFTGFVIAAIWFTLIPPLLRLIRGCWTSPADWFYCILNIPMVFWTTRISIVGTQTDEPATIACLVAAGILFEEFHRSGAKDRQELCDPRLITAASLFALAITFKESAIVFSFLSWCLVLGWIWRRNPSQYQRRPHILAVLALSVLIVLPWIARGIILSGYPFFPATALGLHADWKTPATVASWYAVGANSWGRMPDVAIESTRGFSWLRPWLNSAIRNRASFQVPLMISLGSLVVLLGRLRKKSCTLQSWPRLLGPSLVAIVFWIVASPALRFAQFAIWTLAGTLGAWAIVSLTSLPRRVSVDRIVLAGLSALFIWCLISSGWRPPYERLFAAPPLAPLPVPRVIARQTKSGLTIYVPVEGNQCWDAPLPCTPYFDETLRLRDPQSMRFGFTSESQGDHLPKL